MDSKAFSEDSDALGAELRRLRAENQQLRAKNRQLRAKLGLVHSDDSSEDEVSCSKLIYLEKIGLKGQLYNLLLIK